MRQANYSSLRAELVEFRRRAEQLQHGVIAHQLCRPVWARWLETAVLVGALELPDFARSPARYRPFNWIPPRWDWVDPLKDIQAQVLAMEAGIISRRKVVEATGYDVEEIHLRNAPDLFRQTEPPLPTHSDICWRLWKYPGARWSRVACRNWNPSRWRMLATMTCWL